MAPYHPLLGFSVNRPSQIAAFGTRRRLRGNGGGRKEGVVEERGVSLDGGSGRGGESRLGSSSQQCTCEENAFDTMHAWSGIVGCHCRQRGMSTVALMMGLPGSGFAHLSNVRGRFLSQAGTKMMCSSREDPSVLPRNLSLEDSSYGHTLQNHSVPTRVQCAVSSV